MSNLKLTPLFTMSNLKLTLLVEFKRTKEIIKGVKRVSALPSVDPQMVLLLRIGLLLFGYC